MANRKFNWMECYDRHQVALFGSFAPNGSSAVDQDSIKGEGITSVTRTGVGAFDVVFDDGFVDLVATLPGKQITTGAGDMLEFGDWDSATRTLAIRNVDDTGAGVEIAANANNRVSFLCVFSDASVP